MTGWLIVNSFIDSDKFNEIYSLLLNAAKSNSIELQLVKSEALCDTVGSNFNDKPLPDFAIFWDKDICLAQMLENAGVRLFNRAWAIDCCDNKARTYIELSKAGIPVPKTIIAPKTFEGVGYNSYAFLDAAIKKLGLPLIIKEAYGSFGQQVYLANTENEAKAIIKKAGHKELVLQEFISSSCGRDIRINIVGTKAVASMLRVNDKDFRSNISNGGEMKGYVPTPQQIKIAVDTVKALKLDFAGVDVLFGKDNQPIICEVNSNPHFKSTLQCTGINLADSIIEHISSELKLK